MAEITSLASISGDVITIAQVHGLIAKIDVTIYNIIAGNGTWTGLDHEENGPMGFRSKPTELLRQLRETRKMYVDMLNDPAALGDNVILLSQWDNPDL